MDPLYERRLREEVIFLHSLWYQGPPNPPAANHHFLLHQGPPIPAAAVSVSANRHCLQPSKPTKFKKGKERKGKNRKIFPNNATPNASSSHGAEWPCTATPPPTTSWPLSLTVEEQSKFASKSAYQLALKAVQEFVRSDNADGFDEIDSSDDGGDGGEMMEENRGREELSFFYKVFEDSGLREFYEKNFVDGEFSCLVCGVESAKKFKGCLSLVQHSITIGKTKRRRAHRALAQAVCKVLGWEINRLPEIVSMLMADKLGNTQGNGSVAFVDNGDSVKDDRIDDKDDEAAPASDAMNFSACPDGDTTGNEDRPTAAPTIITSASGSVPITAHPLQPSEATQFHEKQHNESGEKLDNYAAAIESNSSQGAGWSCPSPPLLPSTSGWSSTGWATLEKSSPKPTLLSTEQQLILTGRHAHQHALKVVHEFFYTNKSNDSDEITSSSDDDEAELMEGDGKNEDYTFFFNVFEEDLELREYYVKNFAEGEFRCLVCGAMGGKNTGKKFKGCLPLVQHSSTIAKTKKRKGHRAFGQAVCKVLGWDIDCLPTIESMLSDKAGNTQAPLNEQQQSRGE